MSADLVAVGNVVFSADQVVYAQGPPNAKITFCTGETVEVEASEEEWARFSKAFRFYPEPAAPPSD